MVMLVVSTTLTARQKPTTLDKQQPEDKEQVLFQRVFDAQMNGSDSDFYQAHEAFMNYLESRQDWEKYYRAWLNRVIYDVNHKYFHRAFTEINYITDDIKDRHQEQYLYTTHLGMGLFFNGRNQPEEGEKYFRRALQGIDAEKEPAAVFNSYLSLAQSLSFTRPAEAMACLDSLPQQMLQNPMYESGVLGYRCIIANTLGDRTAFNRYFSRYDSIRQNLPDQFNAANLHQVMVCRCLMQNDYRQALAWCDSIDVPLTATELRIDVYEQMGDWKQAFRASEIRDSLRRLDEREALEIHTKDMEHDIDLLQAEQEKAKIRHIQLVIVGLMALAIQDTTHTVGDRRPDGAGHHRPADRYAGLSPSEEPPLEGAVPPAAEGSQRDRGRASHSSCLCQYDLQQTEVAYQRAERLCTHLQRPEFPAEA